MFFIRPTYGSTLVRSRLTCLVAEHNTSITVPAVIKVDILVICIAR